MPYSEDECSVISEKTESVCTQPIYEKQICERPICERPICERPICERPICELRIEAGRRFYLKRTPVKPIFIAPNVTVTDYVLHLCFDLKDGSELVIPKDAKVMGEWVNYGNRIRYQTNSVRIDGCDYPFSGLSDPSREYQVYNNNEVNDACYFHRTGEFRTQSNFTRRTVNVNCRGRTLNDFNLNSVYQYYNTHQIKCTLYQDFILTY